MNLTGLDLIVIAIPFAVIILVAVVMRRYMRSVADFLAANRCAGRYLIQTAMAAAPSVMGMIVALEVFSKVGWSLEFWNSFTAIIWFFLGLLGLVSYRYRETRSLTFHQFFEVRYSKGVRIFASFLHVFSGVLTFGIQPAIGARFFVYFCGFPEHCTVAGMSTPTYVPIMVILMAVSLYFALSGGQISIMVTDCMENMISSVFFLIIAGYLVCTVSISQVRTVLLSGPAGGSFVDPFDIGSRADFNGWYIVIGILLSFYWYRGGAWNQGFSAAAKSAHEGRMAIVLGNWRSYSYTSMAILVSLGAFTLLHHSDFAAQRATVEQTLSGISLPQMRTQMEMPTAISQLLAPGVRGCFCAVLLFGLLASQGIQLHSYGSTLMQDVFLPMRKTPLAPQQHIRWLKIMVFGVAIFTCIFSVLYKPVDYLIMATALLGAIYLGGIGLVVWGGLYWKKGTTAAAWTSMAIGFVLAVLFSIFQQVWQEVTPPLMHLLGSGVLADYLAAHPNRCPLNGQQLTLITVIFSALSYIVVSLLTCRQDFNLDAMLHRGKYRVEGEATGETALGKRSWLSRWLGISEEFTRGDKVLVFATFGWTMFWQVLAVGILAWTVFVGRLSPQWWVNYMLVTAVGVSLVIAVFTSIWFMIGVYNDLRELFRTLETAKRSDADDGTVRNHLNADDVSCPRISPTEARLQAPD